MAIWDKVRQGIDKAGKAAQDVLDEGKLRIDAYRAREQADKAAEALGYAVYRALDSGHELESAARDRLVQALRERENEAKRLEIDLAAAREAGEAAAPTTNTGTTGPVPPTNPFTNAAAAAGAYQPASATTNEPPAPGTAQQPTGSTGQGTP